MFRVSHEGPDLFEETALAVVARTLASVRRSEWVLWAFLGYTVILAALAPLPPITRWRTISVNMMLLAAYWKLVAQEMVHPHKWSSIARDWLPLLFALLAYREMGWFAVPHATHGLEARWIVCDRIFLRSGPRTIIESIGPLLPGFLELAYLLVYALGPFSVAMLYVYGRRSRVDQFLFLFLVGTLLCYAQFPFWPSDPPRTLFPTEDLPAYMTIFRQWNLWLLGIGESTPAFFRAPMWQRHSRQQPVCVCICPSTNG